LEASGRTGKGSGSRESRLAPSARRRRNSSVLARSSSSPSFSISGSRALIRATSFWNWRSRRSLRLPKMRVSKLLSIGKAGWKRAGAPGRERNGRGSPGEASRPASLTWGRGADYQGRPLDSAAHLVQVLAGVHLAAVEDDLEMQVRAGGTAGGADLGDLLAGPHHVAHLHQVGLVVGV